MIYNRILSSIAWPAAAVLAAIVAMPAQAQQGQATVTTDLNHREGPGRDYRVIQVLPGGATVAVFECEQGWCRVRYDGRTGWAFDNYLRFSEAASGPPPAASGSPPPPGDADGVQATTTTALNMRRGPSTDYSVILTIPANATVTVQRCTNSYNWCEVTYSGRTGFVYAAYIRSTQQQAPVADVGAQIGLRLFEFVLGQIGNAIGDRPDDGNDRPGDDDGNRTPGANEICFYEDFGYGGNAFCVAMGQSDASLSGDWNDAISSIRVGANARVEVCQNDNYGGWCEVFENSIAQLPSTRNDAISSYRTTGFAGGGNGAPGDSDDGRQAEVCFFADFNFGGDSICVQPNATSPQMPEGWNDRVSSIRIAGGAEVQVCQDANFGGWCERFSESVAELPTNRNDEISSFRVRQ